MGRGRVCRREAREQADLPVHRLLDVPLVPRDGARVVRERRDRGRHQPRLHSHQGRSRGTPRRRSRLHDVRAGDDRIRRLADERVADARAGAVLRRHVLPAAEPLEHARVSGGAAVDRALVGNRPAARRPVGPDARERSAAPWRRASDLDRRHDCRAGATRGGRPAVRGGLRCPARRLRRRAEVPTAERAAVPAARTRANGGGCAEGHGAADAARDGARRDARPRRRRLSSLFRGRQLARAALREDALRPGAAGAGVPRSRAGQRRSVLRGDRGGHAAVCRARAPQRGRRVLFGRGRRQHPAWPRRRRGAARRGGGVLCLERPGAARAAG